MYGYKAVLEAARRGDTYEKGIIPETPRIHVYREEERHHALGRDATFSWSRALTHPPRCNRTHHRGRHLVSDFVGPPSWISRRGGRHLGSEVVGAAILDLTS